MRTWLSYLFWAVDKKGGSAFQHAASLGLSATKRLFYIVLPMIKPAIISAATLGFAHTLGEFGLVLMIGGNLSGDTQVMSIALYNHVEALDYDKAHVLALILLVSSFISLILLYKFNRPQMFES